jgi:uncharacterized repeat protein (TIGR01451 family)
MSNEVLCPWGEIRSKEEKSMNGRRKLLVAVVLAAALLASVAAVAPAADPARPELALSVEVRKEAYVKDADGKEKLEWREAGDVRPGDILKYTIAYRNGGRSEARSARIVDPVPKETVYIPGSAEGKDAAIAFSLDGKSFREPALLKQKVRRPDGTEGERQAPPETYTHIQWTLLKAVPPGGGGAVSFKVRVK